MKKIRVYLGKELLWEKEFTNMEEYSNTYKKVIDFRNVYFWGLIRALPDKLEDADALEICKSLRFMVEVEDYKESINIKSGLSSELVENVKSRKFKKGESYWYVSSNTSRIRKACWRDRKKDHYRYSIGNVFKKERYAKFMQEREKVIEELKRYAEEHDNRKVNWNDENQEKWYICYDARFNGIKVLPECINKDNNIYFASEKVAVEAIEKIDKGRILTYYFGL